MLAEATQNTTRPTDYDDVKVTVTTSSTVITPLAAWRAPPLLTAVFCIIALSGFLSNTFVLVVFGKRENFRRPSSLCIINLAVGDMIVCLGVPLRIVSYEGLITWSDGLCQAYTVVRFLPIFVSINTMVVMAFDRRVAILDPTQFRDPYRSRSMRSRLLGAWLLAIVALCAPVYRTELVPCDNEYCCKVYDLPILIYIFSLIIALPCLIFVIIYGHIFIALQLKHAAHNTATCTMTTRTSYCAPPSTPSPGTSEATDALTLFGTPHSLQRFSKSDEQLKHHQLIQQEESDEQLKQQQDAKNQLKRELKQQQYAKAQLHHQQLQQEAAEDQLMQQQQMVSEVDTQLFHHQQQRKRPSRHLKKGKHGHQHQGEVVIVISGPTVVKASNNSRRSRHAVKAAKVLLLTTALFIVCYLPTFVLWFVYIIQPSAFVDSLVQVYLFQSCSMLIFFHSSLNPIVYFAFSATYRRQLCRTLTLTPCCNSPATLSSQGRGGRRKVSSPNQQRVSRLRHDEDSCDWVRSDERMSVIMNTATDDMRASVKSKRFVNSEK